MTPSTEQQPLTGGDTPVPDETSITGLSVEGALPPALSGRCLRTGPNPIPGVGPGSDAIGARDDTTFVVLDASSSRGRPWLSSTSPTHRIRPPRDLDPRPHQRGRPMHSHPYIARLLVEHRTADLRRSARRRPSASRRSAIREGATR